MKNVIFAFMKAIRNIALIFLILELSIPKGVFHFAAHLSVFLHHFNHDHHKETSFKGFLETHSHHHNNNEKQHSHEDISLNHPHISYYNIPAIFYLKYKSIPKEHLTFLYIQKKIIPHLFFYTFEFSRAIWQPPKNS